MGRAHHDDPLAGGDEAAGLDCWQQLARRLEHLVNLGVGQALDVDERLLGHRQEALDGGEASVFDFLSLDREERESYEESTQLLFSTRGVGEARKGAGGERARRCECERVSGVRTLRSVAEMPHCCSSSRRMKGCGRACERREQHDKEKNITRKCHEVRESGVRKRRERRERRRGGLLGSASGMGACVVLHARCARA